MVHFSLENDAIIISADSGDLGVPDVSQLAYWGFTADREGCGLHCSASDVASLLPKLISYFNRAGIAIALDDALESIVHACQYASESLSAALQNGDRLKNGLVDREELGEFSSFLKGSLTRRLKGHQCKAALHLLQTQNGANFSVPGSGKTTVVLAVFQRLKELGEVDALFVVGPPACFGPWRTEYRAVIGKDPVYEIMAGGDIDLRRYKYIANADNVCDLYLTTFQTLQRDWEHVRVLFQRQGVRFYLVVDEAHYIKQNGGAWATAVLNVAQHASRRCVLTGTPFPNSYNDAFNLFDVLWPNASPISPGDRRRIELHVKRNEIDQAAELLDSTIGPLFYRVRKSELGLAPQVFNPPIGVQMNRYERLAYDTIIGRIRQLSQTEYVRDLDLAMRLRRGRMMRLRQCLSYAAMLSSAVEEYQENLVVDDLSLADIIQRYDQLETPAKLASALSIVDNLRKQGEKVVIWSNFVRTLKLLRQRIRAAGRGVELIYGGTPVQQVSIRDELTREEIIQRFVDPESGVDVLVANPAACAESVSLHKSCSHAIYYDMSYNCAQYLQSLDRIHRVGGSENKTSYYHFLQYEDSIDDDILTNVQGKAGRMSAIIDRDYAIYSLDMFDEDEDLQAYERLFKK